MSCVASPLCPRPAPSLHCIALHCHAPPLPRACACGLRRGRVGPRPLLARVMASAEPRQASAVARLRRWRTSRAPVFVLSLHAVSSCRHRGRGARTAAYGDGGGRQTESLDIIYGYSATIEHASVRTVLVVYCCYFTTLHDTHRGSSAGLLFCSLWHAHDRSTRSPNARNMAATLVRTAWCHHNK